MTEKVVLVTGSLAEPRLGRLSTELANDELNVVGSNVRVKVAALMTTEIVERQLEGVDQVIMPGRFRSGDRF